MRQLRQVRRFLIKVRGQSKATGDDRIWNMLLLVNPVALDEKVTSETRKHSPECRYINNDPLLRPTGRGDPLTSSSE